MKLISSIFNHLNLNSKKKDTTPLENKISYKFQDISILTSALTHSSITREETNVSPFERMEFLGDAVLGLVVSEEIFSQFPTFNEGNLSKLKAKLVSRKYLALCAAKLDLGSFISVSNEAQCFEGKKARTILGNAMESLICAIYLDSNLEQARKFIREFILQDIQSIRKLDNLKNYKSILQEHCQSISPELPEYKVINEIGPEHDKTFTIKVFLSGQLMGIGEGKSKKEAQQFAAKDALQKLEK